MIGLRAAAAAVVGVVLLAGQVAAQEQRFALVIGNSEYGQGALPNPVNDAVLMETRLAEVGFEVVRVNDGNERQMERAIVDFAVNLQDAGSDAIGFFYYAGHGIQSNGENYLIPVGAEIGRRPDLGAEAIRANWILEQLESAGNRMNFIVLDACRNNPLPRSIFRASGSGLAEMRAPVGTFIGYSTAPGTTATDGEGDNSPYAVALAAEIDAPGVAAEIIFRRVRDRVIAATDGFQVPWDASSLTGDDFFFKTSTTTTTPDGSMTISTTTTEGQLVGGDRIELAFWESIMTSTDAADFSAYLERYPDGAFSPLARNRLASLNPGDPVASEPAATPDFIVDARGGGDFRTIQEAINASRDGALIHVRPGAYREDLTFEQDIGVTLVGLGEGANRPRVVAAQFRPIYVVAGQPTIENFILEGPFADYASVWAPAGRPRIVNNAISSASNSCVYVEGPAAPVVQGNEIGPCGFHGVFIAGDAAGIYESNRITGTGQSAVYVNDRATPSIISNRIVSSDVSSVEVWGTARPYVFENTIEGGMQGVVVGGAALGRYENNTIAGVQGVGFWAREQAAPQAIANIVSNSPQNCIWADDRSTGRFDANTLRGCGSISDDGAVAPLAIAAGAAPVVVDNVIEASAYAADTGYLLIDNRNPAVDVALNAIRP